MIEQILGFYLPMVTSMVAFIVVTLYCFTHRCSRCGATESKHTLWYGRGRIWLHCPTATAPRH